MTQPCHTGPEAAIAAIRAQVAIIHAMAPGVSELDPGAIHDMRVASRRLRMAIRVYQPYLDPRDGKQLRKQAKKITGALGIRRELDVMAAMLREHREETRTIWRRFMDHAIEVIDRRRDAQAPYCQEAVALAADLAGQEGLDGLLRGAPEAGGCLISLAQSELRVAFQLARHARRAWKQSGDAEDLHQVRIELKHLRYACEFHAGLFGEPMAAFIGRVKGAQNLLGEWNECRLLEDMVLTLGNAADYRLAQGAPLVAEAYGNRAADLAEQFREAGKALLGRRAAREFKGLVKQPAAACCNPEV